MMCFRLSTVVLFFVGIQLVAHSSSAHAQSEVCSESLPEQAPALLQLHRTESSQGSMPLEEGSRLTLSSNPSGAAATLDEAGYAAVADRCCQADMRVFMKRQALNLNLDICDENGLAGLAPWHSCEKGPQTFAALSSNLLEDSSNDTDKCRWIAPTGNCTDRASMDWRTRWNCPNFVGAAPSDCLCSKSQSGEFNMTAGTVTHSNLGGVGPDGGAKELRFSKAGTTLAGVSFDLVLTSLNAYQTPRPQKNGMIGKFGAITMGCSPTDTSTDFKASFVRSGTNTAVTLSEVHFAVFDLDGPKLSGAEVVASKGYRGYVTDANPTLAATRLADGRTQFKSSLNAPHESVSNPRDPLTLTPAQRKISVMYFYTNVSSIEFSFGIENCKVSARYLFFSDLSGLSDRCAA